MWNVRTEGGAEEESGDGPSPAQPAAKRASPRSWRRSAITSSCTSYPLRLHAAASGDPGALSPVQGYAAHYCSVDRETNPTVAACSFITSGLRVFDITDLEHPKEIAYYVAPTQPRAENGFMASDFAMSKPAIIPARREIWYSDGATGFYVLRVDESAWPAAR